MNRLLDIVDRPWVEKWRDETRDLSTYVKWSVLLFLDNGLTQQETAEYLGISIGTVNKYKQKYEDDGLKNYLETKDQPYDGRLTDEQLAELEDEVRQNLYSTSAQVSEWIEKKFEVAYGDRAVRSILSKLGFVYKKTSIVPSKANPSEQEAFVEALIPFMSEVEGSFDEVLYFMDAVHPQHNTRSDYAWIKKGEEKTMPSNPGRQRVNINAAMDAHNPEEVIIVETPTVNAQSTIALFEELEAKHPDQHTVWVLADNARYYYCALLQDWLDKHQKIQLIHLPTYSPNLNLIERLWKFLRKKVINSHFYPHFKDFKAAIIHFFQNLKQYKRELHSLMAPNFQRFSV